MNLVSELWNNNLHSVEFIPSGSCLLTVSFYSCVYVFILNNDVSCSTDIAIYLSHGWICVNDILSDKLFIYKQDFFAILCTSIYSASLPELLH